MKIAQILFSGLGGHGSVVFSMLETPNARERNNLERQELIFYGVETLKSEYIDKCHALKVPYHFVQKKMNQYISPWVKLFMALKKIKPQIIILHDPKLIVPVGLYATMFQCKLIVVEHTPNQVKTKVELWATKRSMEYADKIVVLTQLYYDELASMLKENFKRQKTTIIPNGIDTSLYKPKEVVSESLDSLIMGMAARFSGTKDQKTLIDCFGKISATFPHVRLMLAGDGDTLPKITEYLEKQDFKNQVTLTGSLNEEGLIQFYNNLDIYVHASLGETMSTSIMQALSCGLPIIASDIPGINNILKMNENGLLFKSQNDLELLLRRLLNDTDLQLKLSENARATAVDILSSIRMYDSYSKLIETI